MPGRAALKDKQKQIRATIESSPRDAFSISTGDVKTQTLTLILIGCTASAYRNCLNKLCELLPQHPQLSLYLTKGVSGIQFIVRGTLPDTHWVYKNLIYLADKGISISAFDLECVRCRWVDQPDGVGPIRIQTVRDPQAAAEYVSDGGRWIDAPPEGQLFCVFMASSTETPARVLDIARKSDKPLMRDLFLVQPSSQRTTQEVPVKPQGTFAADFVVPQVIGVAEIGAEGLRLQKLRTEALSVPVTPYLFLADCRAEFDDGGPSMEIIPLEIIREGRDFIDDPNIRWNEALTVEHYIDVGRIGYGPAEPVGPGFNVEQMTTAVVGRSGTGKSIVAYHLLARYLMRPHEFTVIYWNCHSGSERAVPNGEPDYPSALLDYRAIVSEVTSKPVFAAKPADLLRSLEKHGDKNAYYTEVDSNTEECAALCKQLGEQLGGRFIFCFDEIVNRGAHDSLKKYLEHVVNEGRKAQYYVMYLHQQLTQLFAANDKSPNATDLWPGIPNECCFFLKQLKDTDRPLYERYCKDKTAYLDSEFDPFQKAEPTQVGVLQPYRGSQEKPIPLSLPLYAVPDEKEKKRLADEVSWEKVDFVH